MGSHKTGVAVRQVHRKEVDLALDPRDLRQRLAKIHLRMARIVPQWHEHLAMPQSLCLLSGRTASSEESTPEPLVWSRPHPTSVGPPTIQEADIQHSSAPVKHKPILPAITEGVRFEVRIRSAYRQIGPSHRFSPDALLEESGFELLVPLEKSSFLPSCPPSGSARPRSHAIGHGPPEVRDFR